jgi:amino acid transporter
MLLMVTYALAEMAVLYPVNGAFYTYFVRFVDPSWGFAMGWQYAIAWLTVLPFELIAASLTIEFWRDDINMGVWVGVFMAALIIVQFFGVRGYGEVEFVLSLIKILACIGFMILGIVINCGGAGDKGYIGGKYWVEPGAFRNGFTGFCSVFVVAAFAFGGTEMVGLAAAESATPRKSIPQASKQVFFRIALFYIVNLFILGLILPSDDTRLLGSSGANTKASPFVLAIQDAGIKVLPSIFNAVITISVLSVANSCTFGSTRTMQAMAQRGMAPRFLAYVDSKGRPLWCILIQLAFGLLAFIGESGKSGDVFGWLLALTGLAYLLVWGTVCLAHIRMRAAFKVQGISTELIPFKSPYGVIGSYIGIFLSLIALMATFYNALYVSHSPDLLNQQKGKANRCFIAYSWSHPQRPGFLPGLPSRARHPRPVPGLEVRYPRVAHVRAAGPDGPPDGSEPARRARARGEEDLGLSAEALPWCFHLERFAWSWEG